MKRTVLAILVMAFAGMLSISASAQKNTHSVWTDNNGSLIGDPSNGCEYSSFDKFEMITSWTEPTPVKPAQAHFRGIALAYGLTHFCGNHFYEFELNNSVYTDYDTIKGYWDVYRDGVLMCGACGGTAVGLSDPAGVGNYYRLQVNDPIYAPAIWYYNGYIDQRKDY
jgi:hypothetical protein